MIFEETYDYLFNQLAGASDASATTRLADYERKRLRRALLARSIKPYFLEASWSVGTGLVNELNVALTQPVTKPLIVLDGAIRTANNSNDVGTTNQDLNNFELQLIRTGGDARVQISQSYIKDEQQLTPAQAALRPFQSIGLPGQGAPYPLTWPVPLQLQANELIQVKSKILTGGVPAELRTFCQFRGVIADNNAEDDAFIGDLRDYIKAHPMQRPYYLSMSSENAKSITFPATGALQRTTAKTREAPEHLLVIGYSAQFARSQTLAASDPVAVGTTCSPKWRLESSNGYAFSREEIDVNCYAFAGPGFFWQEFPQPFLLPKGCSLSASFSTLDAIANALEQIDNYIFFRCVTV